MAEEDEELGHVDIDDTVQLLLKYDEEVQDRSKHHSRSIYMVPSVYRDLSPRSFTPRVVSIGPLHHQDEHLKGFEVQKATYMHNLLHNLLSALDSTPEQILKECVTKVSGSIDQIKACYVGMQTYTDSELVKMMVTDACFILAFIYDRTMTHSLLGQNNSLYPHTYLDMVLIENQIPFFVLEDIFECTFSKLHPTVPLAKFIFVIQNVCNIFEGNLEINSSNISSTLCGGGLKPCGLVGQKVGNNGYPKKDISSTHDHILGFIQKSYQNPDLDSSTHPKMVKGQSVVELDRSGVRFSAKRDAKWRMAMELKYSRFLCFPLSWSKPTLEMPVLRIHDHSELVIRNLIVYEQSSEGLQTCVTSYMYALDFLVDTPEDVAKLVKSQVLVNYIGSNEEAAYILNNVCKEVLVFDFYYLNEWKQLDEYYNAYWPYFIAELRRKYFSNPWSIIGLLTGIVLFILTVIETFYAVKGGVKDSKAA
ncbi:UPF0481 protein-like protein [Tanacetum coccineum]